jgi:hypothetical protein
VVAGGIGAVVGAAFLTVALEAAPTITQRQ